MIGRSLALATISVALFGCGAPRERPTHLQAETTFLAPYVYARSTSCEGRVFELTLKDRPAYVILTLPAIEESGWELKTCTDAMSFVLDCSNHGEGYFCAAHEWPLPFEARTGNEVSHELAAVIDLAPRCPREKSCLRDRERCVEDGITIRRYDERTAPQVPLSADYATSFYEVERCGVTRAVSVRCNYQSPFACVTDARDLSN